MRRFMELRKKIYFDCEFTGLHKNTTLISIGLISECGKSFYAEFNDYDDSLADNWIKINVIDKLISNTCIFPKDKNLLIEINSKPDIAKKLEDWLYSFGGNIELWSDCLAYDWVLFCDLFGGALNIPNCVYYIPFDICTEFKIKGIDPDIDREEFCGLKSKNKHNALHDAKVIKACHEKMSLMQ